MTGDILFKFWLVGASVDEDLLVFCAGRSLMWDGGSQRNRLLKGVSADFSHGQSDNLLNQQLPCLVTMCSLLCINL